MTTRAQKAQIKKEGGEEIKEESDMEVRMGRVEKGIEEMREMMKTMVETLTSKENKEVSIISDIDSLHFANLPQPATFSNTNPSTNMTKDDLVKDMEMKKYAEASSGQVAVVMDIEREESEEECIEVKTEAIMAEAFPATRIDAIADTYWYHEPKMEAALNKRYKVGNAATHERTNLHPLAIPSEPPPICTKS